jgi:predicted RNA-binding Zn-ribbon protein involved in translation (DUF1610 family)
VKVTFLQLGIYSLETSVRHLMAENDRELMAAVVLGHHAITCFMKAAAQELGQTIGKKTAFPSVLGYLNKGQVFVKGETKALELLNKVRNDIEHDEPEFIRDEFEVALTDCVHIVERLCRDVLQKDLQQEVHAEVWQHLVFLGHFGDERRQHLHHLLSEELGVFGRRILEVEHEFVHCWGCGEEGLLWQGEKRVVSVCKFCGAEAELRRCLVCRSVIYPGDDTTFEGEVHQECFDRWGE